VGCDERLDRLVHVYKGTPGDHCVCDQALRQVAGGDRMVIFMTGGDHEPRLENYIAICRSRDGGTTWSEPQPVLRLHDRACLLSEVVVVGDDVTVFGVSHQGNFEDWRNFTLRSRDGGRTWEEPVPFAPAPRRAFVRNLFVSTWGEWYLPVQSYDVRPDPLPSPLRDGSHAEGANYALISSDEGATWSASESVAAPPGWCENNLVELGDGRLAMLVRADGTGSLQRSDSVDRGRTWSPYRDSGIPNPGSKFRLHRLRDGRVLLVHNASSAPGVRNPLSLWVSSDALETWGRRRTITDFPGQLSYPDGYVDEDDACVHFAFDYNRHDLIAVSSAIPA